MGWHLDKKVTVGIIVALLIQAGSSIWWASRLDSMVRFHDVKLEQHSKAIGKITNESAKTNENLARMEERQKYIQRTVTKIEEAVR